MADLTQEISWVKTPELFFGLSESDFKNLASTACFRTYRRGELVFFTGDTIDKVLVLVDGWVKITHTSEEGREFIIRLHGPGEVVGELAAWFRATHASTAQALQECSVLVWSPAAFHGALEQFPCLGRNTSDILIKRLSELERTFGEISTGTAAPRLAYGLRILLKQMGEVIEEGMEINISQEELGQMTAVDLHEVCRILCGWEHEGLVKLRRGKILIKSVACLQELCRAR
jgi:CRP-like cAMP-binding protein